VVRTGEDDAPDLVAARALVHLVQADEIVFDDLRKGSLDARARKMDQHIDAAQQLIDYGRIAQIAVHDIFARVQWLEWRPAPRRAKVHAALLQLDTKNPAHVAACTGERHFGHFGHPL
jgi:hypothetical protein